MGEAAFFSPSFFWSLASDEVADPEPPCAVEPALAADFYWISEIKAIAGVNPNLHDHNHDEFAFSDIHFRYGLSVLEYFAIVDQFLAFKRECLLALLFRDLLLYGCNLKIKCFLI